MSECIPCKNKRNKLQRIVEGYSNVIKTAIGIEDQNVEEIASNRTRICSLCEEIKPLMKIGDNQLYKCGKCKCPIDAKVRSISENCPLGKW